MTEHYIRIGVASSVEVMIYSSRVRDRARVPSRRGEVISLCSRSWHLRSSRYSMLCAKPIAIENPQRRQPGDGHSMSPDNKNKCRRGCSCVQAASQHLSVVWHCPPRVHHNVIRRSRVRPIPASTLPPKQTTGPLVGTDPKRKRKYPYTVCEYRIINIDIDFVLSIFSICICIARRDNASAKNWRITHHAPRTPDGKWAPDLISNISYCSFADAMELGGSSLSTCP